MGNLDLMEKLKKMSREMRVLEIKKLIMQKLQKEFREKDMKRFFKGSIVFRFDGF